MGLLLSTWRSLFDANDGYIVQFLSSLVTFTAGMAKRAAPGPFAAAPIVQGNWDGSGTPDSITLARGSVFGNPTDVTYDNLDPQQGSISFWWTSEKDSGGAYAECYAFHFGVVRLYYWHGMSTWRLYVGGQTHDVASAVAAGTTYNVVLRWDCKNKLDGTNYACLSINDSHDYGITTQPTVAAPNATNYIGAGGANYAADAIIEGLTIYRRVLFDGTYGVAATFDDSGPVDELAAIYAAGSGADPCLTTGSWDAVLCVPTDSTEEALATGTGEAWSHPHSSNVFNHWTLEDGYYGGGQWAVAFNGTSTYIDCGSAAALDDLAGGGNILTVDGWIRWDTSAVAGRVILKSSAYATNGWSVVTRTDNYLGFVIRLATTDVVATSPVMINDGKWHHFAAYYNDTTKTGRVSVDGQWGSADVGVGAYQSDAAGDVIVGARNDITQYFDGAIGWVRLSDNDRHTAGTDFIPPREFPAADGNTVEAWSLADGTGATVAAQVTSPGNDGTITDGTWEQQWDDVLTPVIPTVLEFDGADTLVNCGSAADIDDLADNAFTVEAWVRADGWGENTAGAIAAKGNIGAVGWQLNFHSTYKLQGTIECATTDGRTRATNNGPTPDGKLHHIAMTWDDATYNYPRLWLDGIEVSDNTQNRVGAVVSDAAADLAIGANPNGNYVHDGAVAWARVSDNIRYTDTFVPPSRANPPAVDGNTVRQFNFTDGAGTTLTDATGTANGTITMGDGRWYNWPDAETTAQGSRVYQWGYVLGSDGAGDGVHQHLASLSAGENYVVRVPLRYEADKRAQPRIELYDETNGASISAFDAPFLTGQHDGGNNSATLSDSTAPYWPYSLVGGTIYNITDGSSATITAAGASITGGLAGGTDNDWDNNDVYFIVPDSEWVFNEPICFELPTIARNGAAADCAEISIRLLNQAGDGVIYWQQAEVYEVLNDEPSQETGAGNPFIISGWTNSGLDAGDTEAEAGTVHSGAASVEWNPGAVLGEGQYVTLSTTIGKYLAMGGWTYGDDTDGFRVGFVAAARALLQYSGSAYNLTTPVDAAWMHTPGVWRALHASPRLQIEADAIAGDGWSDDFYVIELDDVSLTVTPATEANSTETSGLRIDGTDTCTQPILKWTATSGKAKWGWTPRHDAADIAAFGTSAHLCDAEFNANNHIAVYGSAANTVTLEVVVGGVSTTNTWDCTGLITAGTTYSMQLQYDGVSAYLYQDGALRVTTTPAAGINFGANIPNVMNWGSDYDGVLQGDATFS